MCGIVGAVDLEGTRMFPKQRLLRMAESVRHRGPDAGGLFQAAGVSMATRRLALRDVRGGQQPRSDPSRRVWVSFNGELSHPDEIKKELGNKGHFVSSLGDTALLPALYLEHGQELFLRIEGQFALAVWDDSQRVLLLGRDRVGICPLHLAVADGWLLWASEIKALLASGMVDAQADLRGIDQMFSLFGLVGERTCFQGVSSLLPGHFLTVSAGRVERRRYWKLPFATRTVREERTEQAWVDALDQVLRRAVATRLQGDVPVAHYLSGGLDSTVLLAIANEQSPHDRRAFTFGFDQPAFDERSTATKTAGILGVPLETVVPESGEIVQALVRAVTAAESPIMDTANACALLLAERVSARGYKSVLTGEGADEALGGYVWNALGPAVQTLETRAPRLFSHAREALFRAVAPRSEWATLGTWFGSVRPAMLDVYEPLARTRELLYSDALLSSARQFHPLDGLDLDPREMASWDALQRSLALEYKLMLPGHLLLGKGDRVSMSASVEARYPFLDEAFIDLAARVPSGLKTRNYKGKWLLRAWAHKHLPKPMQHRPKAMFKASPLCALQPQPRWVEQLVSEESLARTGYFCHASVARAQRLQRWLPPWAPQRVVLDGSYTVMVMTQLWHHLFLGGGLCELATWSAPTRTEVDELEHFS